MRKNEGFYSVNKKSLSIFSITVLAEFTTVQRCLQYSVNIFLKIIRTDSPRFLKVFYSAR